MIRRRTAGVETPDELRRVPPRNGRPQLQRSTSIQHRLTSRRASLSYALNARLRKKPQSQPSLIVMQTIVKQRKLLPNTNHTTRPRQKNLQQNMIPTTLVRQKNL